MFTNWHSAATVVAVSVRHERATVYNFEVAGTHTYFVAASTGGAGVWAHNKCGGEITRKWPWRQINLSAKQMCSGGGRCKQWAYRLQQAIGGDVIQIIPDQRRYPGARMIGPVYTKEGVLISDRFQEHFAVRIGDQIYDRITGPTGMHIDDYMELFEWAADLLFDRVVR